MLRKAAALCAILLLFAFPAHCEEGTPLLSVDDLLSLSQSYEAFLTELEDLIVERGLLQNEDRYAWHDAQMGDFYQNGGYGSILASYMPGLLGYIREEETHALLRTSFDSGLVLELSTMRRYSPEDSILPGLPLTPFVTDAQGLPQNVQVRFSSDTGVFYKWDSLTQAYASVGTSAVSSGDTVVWSTQIPAAGARSPVILIDITDAESGQTLVSATLTLPVEDYSFNVGQSVIELLDTQP